uniref:Dynein heavy chain coiled coil stalk domain-containing protein n=1 Tax=Euplotes crassus TaxID=5936 RepID=A0A7S3KVB9_EUPCR|mmetsp:Transcript_9885/g.9732  ORF Transcript_9885/g.9732 Transcript_9885/m.9732 type:complete len:619 (+) Transcript_9885:512-2368(+)
MYKPRAKTAAVSPKNNKREEVKGSSDKPFSRAASVEDSGREINSWENLLTLWSEDTDLTPEKQEEIKKEIDEFSFNLDRKQITEMKSLAKPPAAVLAVMQGVCTAFGLKNTTWMQGQKLLKDPRAAIESIINFDKDKIGYYTCKKIYSFIHNLSQEKVKSVSLAAVGLFCWLKMLIQCRAYIAVTNNEPVPAPKKSSHKRRSVMTSTRTRFSVTKASSPFVEEKVTMRTPVKSPFAKLKKGRTSSPSGMKALAKPAKITNWEDLIFDVDKEEYAKASNKKNFLEEIFMFTNKFVEEITPAQIKEMIHLRQPHNVLKKVASGLVIAFGVRDLSWGNVQSFFKGTNVLRDMMDYDNDIIEFKTCKRIHRKVNDLDLKQVMNVSNTALSFYSWLRCIVYHRVYLALHSKELVPATKASPEKKNPTEEGETDPNIESSLKSADPFEVAKEEEKVQSDVRNEDNSNEKWKDLYLLDPEQEDMTLEQFVATKEFLKQDRSAILNKKDIAEITSMKNPPTVVQQVLRGLMVAFGHLGSYGEGRHAWKSPMWFIDQKSFFKLISEFDVDHIEHRTCQKIHSYINSLTEQTTSEASTGTLRIYIWLKHLLNYRVYLALSNEESSTCA